MIQISHEVPLILLEQSRVFNDYDYALVHLFKENKQYYDFFKKSLGLGRRVILDNSIFELESKFDNDVFIDYIKELKPTEYIIPDSLENLRETIQSAEDFIKKYKSIDCKSIGVIQGKTYKELKECYIELVTNIDVDKVAISFDYSYYQSLFPNEGNKYVSWMEGRRYLIDRFLQDGVLNENKPHHLLGCSLPQEFKYYRDMEFIDTIDTSNPIIHGIHNVKYSNWGLDSKISVKLVELLNIESLSEEQTDSINYNIKKFRNFTK